MSAGRMSRSDIVVEKSPNDRQPPPPQQQQQQSSLISSNKPEPETTKEIPSTRSGRLSDRNPSTSHQNMVVVELPGIKRSKTRGDNTPNQSTNGSIRGANKTCRINTRSKGTVKSFEDPN
jgi:hypothetical protein